MLWNKRVIDLKWAVCLSVPYGCSRLLESRKFDHTVEMLPIVCQWDVCSKFYENDELTFAVPRWQRNMIRMRKQIRNLSHKVHWILNNNAGRGSKDTCCLHISKLISFLLIQQVAIALASKARVVKSIRGRTVITTFSQTLSLISWKSYRMSRLCTLYVYGIH